MALNGSEVFVFVWDKSLAADGYGGVGKKFAFVGEQTNSSVEQSNNLIEAHSKKDGHVKFVYGKQDGSLSVEAYYDPNAQAANKDQSGLLVLKKSKAAKAPVKLMVARAVPNGSGGYNLSEQEYTIGYVESISSDYPDDEMSTVKVEIQLIEPMSSTEYTNYDSQLVGS